MNEDDKARIEEIITRGVSEAIDKEHLKKRLLSGEKLRVKYGADPTRPDLHLGHAVGLRKLKLLQDLGHYIIFIIGDFTALVGDPSGKSKTRPVMAEEEIKQNSKTYFDQVGKILDKDKIEIRKNSEWFSSMTIKDVIKLESKFTIARTIERNDFEDRLKAGIDVGNHEILYPMMQAYDSLILDIDLEVEGNDQKFNVHAGRELQRKMGKPEQDILLVPLLVGLDGKEKMSKSLDNYIGITEEPNSMFGKVMSIPDTSIINYFELCTDVLVEEIKQMEKDMQAEKVNPRDLKLKLAEEIVKIYHGEKEAEKAKEYFVKTFSKKETPVQIPEVKIDTDSINLVDFIVISGNAKSKSEARRKIEKGGEEIDGKKVGDWKLILDKKYNRSTLKIGKFGFAKIKFV